MKNICSTRMGNRNEESTAPLPGSCDIVMGVVEWIMSDQERGRASDQSGPGLLSISRSKCMVLDGRNRRNRMSAGRAKSFVNS